MPAATETIDTVELFAKLGREKVDVALAGDGDLAGDLRVERGELGWGEFGEAGGGVVGGVEFGGEGGGVVGPRGGGDDEHERGG